MNLAEEFTAWVQDPRRTNDELFLAELLVEAGHDKWHIATKAPWSKERYYEKIDHEKMRELEPAYRPKISRKKLKQTEQFWAQVESIATGCVSDRPVADLTALHFFPQLTTIEVVSRLTDLTGLKVLSSLRKLRLRDERLADLSAIASHAQLEDLSLQLRWPWPDLRSVAQLPALKRFKFDGNILAMAGVERLPLAEDVELGGFYLLTVPLRDLTQLPDMPSVKKLKVEGTCDLRGLERYPWLEKLELTGPFKDLAPISSLQHLRELTLLGECFCDLAPLARLPRLRTLELQREHGLDLTPLSDSPTLRQVKSRCKVLQTELATLNAALGFVDDSDFLAPTPRPVCPLRYLSWRSKDAQFIPTRRDDERDAFYGDDPMMHPAERRWFKKLVEEKLATFGDSQWIKIAELHTSILVELFRVQEAAFVRQMAEALHQLLCATRFRWEIVLRVALDEEPEEEEDWTAPDRSVFDVEREREEWEEQQQYQKEREQVIEREHRMSLCQPPNLAATESAVLADDDEPDDTVKNADDTPPALDDGEDDDNDVVDDRHFQLWLEGGIVWMHEQDVEDVREFFPGVMIEDWHELPEPPDQRPQWRC